MPAPLITVRKFDITGNSLNGWCFSISGTASDRKCAPSGSNVVTFSNLSLGSYSVSEEIQTGWQFVRVTGTNCTQVAANNASVTLTSTTPTATCDFVNSATPASAYLSSFQATGRAHNAKLKWTTVNEMDVLGFNVLRSDTKQGVYTPVNTALITAKHLGELTGAKYTYKDRSVQAGKTYFYRIQVVGAGGELELSDIKRVRIPATP